ncbi:Phytanoyl-CoA dioxygenase (PhyH) [Anatilimnocola aggregata]|uniref:Phytanoyl-CoA dioxygenase (PhyH) n=1 Tax=Anatilimnocola aggregata TaxID=2528021 RepID=A0A517Y816_9BACT|nr:phytanoyl-CoA dioxygenase family protein [Anatilimnocola aggregata]QDU26341.1 Phytanoyl-CoA dioxygenase (PhyH) [Anatilimnocola aggregata]
MDYRSCKPAFDRDGYVIVRQFLSADELTELKGELARYIREVVPTLPAANAFYEDKSRPETLKQLQNMELDSYFEQYQQHPRWRLLAETLVDEPATALAPEWFNKPRGTNHVTPPHQDNYYFCLRPPHVVTLWLALDVVDEANGCLRYLPGSHLTGIRPHGRSNVLGFSQGITDYGDEDRAAEVQIHLQPGDVVAHHGNLVHRAEANHSPDRERRAFALVYRGQSCQRDDEAFDRYQAALRTQHQQLGLAN